MKTKLIFAVLICAACLQAQAPAVAGESSGSFFSPLTSAFKDPVAPTFPSPAYFRKLISTPDTHVEIQPIAKLEDYVRDGKLVLSLKAYLDLVMANNTDIAIQRLTVERSMNSLLSSYSRFDPSMSFSLSHQRSASISSDAFDQVTQLKSLSQSGSLQYSQLLPTGTTIGGSLGLSKSTSNSRNNLMNPNLGANFGLNFSQPLLRGRSLDIVRMNITTAKINLKSSRLSNVDSIMSYIQTAETAYWTVVGSRESLKVSQNALALQEKSYERSSRELELGMIPELDIYSPQAQLENAKIRVETAKASHEANIDSLRRQIGADLDPRFRDMEIELTEAVEPPNSTAVLDAEALIQQALNSRPDIARNRLTLESDDLSVKQAVNNLRPQLTLTGSYSATGNSGTRYNYGSSIPTMTGGFTDALSTAFARDNPTYRFGISMTLPLRDRAAAANYANSLIQKKSDTLTLRRAEQSIRLEVKNAITNLRSSREQVRMAQVSVDLAQKQLAATQKKYDLGTTDFYFVLQYQNDLATANSNLVTNYINYHRNELTLLRVTGQLLEKRGIVVQ
jgi:outer membrane protein TolC